MMPIKPRSCGLQRPRVKRAAELAFLCCVAAWPIVLEGEDGVPGERFRARSLTYAYDEGAIFAMPSEKIPLSVTASATRLHSIDAPQGALTATGPNKWTWEAPVKPGVYPLKVKSPEGQHRGGFFRVCDGPEHESPPGRAECVSDRSLPGRRR